MSLWGIAGTLYREGRSAYVCLSVGKRAISSSSDPGGKGSSHCANPQASYLTEVLSGGPSNFLLSVLCFLASDLIPPVRRLLQDLFPKAAELYERVASNREHWTKVSHKFTIRGLPSNNSLDFLDEEYEVPDLDGTRAPVNGCCSLEG